MSVPLNKTTKLQDRILCFDGDSIVSETQLLNLLGQGNSGCMCVDQITPQIEQYNKLVSRDQQIKQKNQIRENDLAWKLPEEYLTLDIKSHIKQLLNNHISKSDDQLYTNQCIKRVQDEIQLFEQHGLFDVLRSLIYIINTLTSENLVWGVGRGSSTSSFILYLIGVHDVDSVLYQLDITDFLHQ